LAYYTIVPMARTRPCETSADLLRVVEVPLFLSSGEQRARAENIGRNDRDFLRKEADAGPEDGDRGDKVQRAVMPVIYRYRRDGEEFAEFWKRVTPVVRNA